jgi:protein-S-isoprenylcysteine O-methyltransferase Ste14
VTAVPLRSTAEFVNAMLWLAWWVSWMLAAFWRARAATQPPGRSQILYRVLAIAGAVFLFDRIVPRLDVPLWRWPVPVQWALVVVSAYGFAFTWWARLHLGRLWSSNVGRKADHRIIDTGPYAIVRHPIYTGIIIASCSTAALRATVAAWIGVALMTLGWYVKARLEERFLREQLGPDNYDTYARRVPMLIPFTR